MTTIRTGFKSTSAAALIGLSAVIGVAAVPTLAPLATAQTQPSNIDVNRQGSITIHKRAGEEGTQNDTGNVNPAAPGTPLPGASFTIRQVQGLDLATNAGLVEASKLTVADAQGRTLGAPQTKTTDAQGQAAFTGLPVGVYLVTEDSAPAGYAPGAPFLVYIPMTNPANTSQWNYDVNVYPKNSAVTAEKAVGDAGQNVGDTVTFSITSSIPQPANNGTISKYTIVDDLQENLVSTTADNVTAELTAGGTTLAKGTDYTVTVDAATQKVEVVFTPAGLTKLSDAKKADPTVEVKTTIVGTVKDVTTENGGHLVNEASVISNRGGGSGDVTQNTNQVNTYWGTLKIAKQDDAQKPLAGAKFQVFECTSADALGKQIAINSVNEWTTAADGSVVINGLHVTDYENGAEITAAKKYCLVETQAPEGYELLAKPVEVNFTRSDVANTADGTDAITQLASVTNVKSNGPKLPLTGGTGIGLVALLGAVLVGAGAWWARRNSSKA